MSAEKRDFRFRRIRALQYLVWLLLRAVLAVIDMFPWSSAPAIGRFLGRTLRLIDRKHLRIAAKNLERSGTVVRPDEIPAFLDRHYDHLGLGFVEMLMTPRLMQRHAVSDFVRLERFEVLTRCMAEGRGVIVALGHLGNWELGGLAATLAGYPVNSLARPVENPWVDRYLNGFRTQTGQKIIPKYHALQSMIRVLQKSEILVIQVDQDARHAGVFVDFFGRPASTHRSPALLSLKYGTPVCVVNVFREGRLHRAVMSDPIRPEEFKDRADPVQALTQAITARFEEYVRAHPEQWFWVHDRWKTAERAARRPEEAIAPRP